MRSTIPYIFIICRGPLYVDLSYKHQSFGYTISRSDMKESLQSIFFRHQNWRNFVWQAHVKKVYIAIFVPAYRDDASY